LVLYRLLNSGVSQRRSALILGIDRKTVARKLVRLGRVARCHHARLLRDGAIAKETVAVIDEMETIEHTKLKPLAVAVAVVEGSRYVIGAQVSSMPAKGRLAKKSRAKYGRRADHRSRGLSEVLRACKEAMPEITTIKSDECPRYPSLFKTILPGVARVTSKGRRACVVGQGELKAGGIDPLFSLNQTCAMFRDNLKTLTRRTWCTPKRPDRLQALIDIYVTFHNERLVDKWHPPGLPTDPI
jgi:hypothetical protein